MFGSYETRFRNLIENQRGTGNSSTIISGKPVLWKLVCSVREIFTNALWRSELQDVWKAGSPRKTGSYDPDFHRSSSTTEVIFSSPQLRWKVSNVNQMPGPCPYQSTTAVWLVLLGNSDLGNTGHYFSFYCLQVTAFALKYHKQNKTTWWADRKSTNMRRKWRCFYC